MPSRMDLFRDAFLRHGRWLWLWMKELAWRIFTPKVQGLLLTLLLTVIAALLLRYFDMFDPNAYKNALKEGLKHSDLDTLVTTTVVVLFGGATAIWSVFAVLTDSLLPGTPDAAKNYSLGSGDPLERFRLHFNRMVESLEQPILIAVDDIDRCEPRFVVALLQGIQTIFRSPRVVFVLLGDRDWIEQAFASVHSAMTGIDVGPEHTFGGRFVEKAIQLSLVLPAIGREGKGRYVRQLLGIRDEPQEEDESPLSKQEEQKVGEQLSDIVDMEDQLQREAEAASLRKRIQTEGKAGDPAKSEAIKQIDRQMALRSASDKTADDATRHRLIPIASVLPANPRQIKRIINGIALFQAIAQLEQQIQPGSADWCKLALWVVIMTEWPRTWATLSTYPGLLDRVRDPRGKATGALPDELRTDAWAAAIQDNEAIMQLLDFSSSLKTGRRKEEVLQSPDVVPDEGNWIEAKIDPSTIERFRAFMPAVGGKLLPDPAEESET